MFAADYALSVAVADHSPKAEGVKPRVEVTAGICTVCEVRSTLKRSSVSVKHKRIQPCVGK